MMGPYSIFPRVLVVLVNWRQPERTLEAVGTVRAQTVPADICVVDNGSEDDSAEILKADQRIDRFIESKTNLGFGGGCNLGVEYALQQGYEFVWLLNNDAKAHGNALYSLLRCFDGAEVGLAGGRINDPSGIEPDHCGAVLNAWTLSSRCTLSELELNSKKYAWITGACMLIRVSALQKVGGFDEQYFMYWEDSDLCIRFKRAGWRLAVADQAYITHTAGSSSNEQRLNRYSWHLNSQLHWIKKFYQPRVYGILVLGARNILKSIVDFNIPRLSMTICSLWRAAVKGSK